MTTSVKLAIVAGTAFIALCAALIFYTTVPWHAPMIDIATKTAIYATLVGMGAGVALYQYSKTEIDKMADRMAKAAASAGLTPKYMATVMHDAQENLHTMARSHRAFPDDMKDQAAAAINKTVLVVQGLEADPSDIARSERFLHQQLPAAANVFKQFADLVTSHQGSSADAQVRERMRTFLKDFETTCQRQYDNNVADNAEALDLDIAVLSGMLEKSSPGS